MRQGRWLWWLSGTALCLLAWAAGCPGPKDDPTQDAGQVVGTPPLNNEDGGTPPPPDLDGGPPPDAGTSDAGEDPPPPPPLPPPDPDAVRKENQRAGSTDWDITRQAANHNEIEGYPLVATVTQGQRVPVAVSVSEEPHTFSWFVYRLGYYGGLRAREVARSSATVRGVKQGDCPPDPKTGVVACAWASSFDVDVKSDWVRGAYLVKLKRDDGYQRFVPFFVRDANPRSEVVVVIPTATWAAYNTWGGTSLYDDTRHVMSAYGVSRAFQSSYDRPYYRNQGSGHLLGDDISLIVWLESQGLDVGYATDEDMDATGDFLRDAKVIFLSGHDEYWSRTLRGRMDKAVSEGRSLLNLGANNGYWQVRLDSAKDGRSRRIVTCYKGHAADPVATNSPARTMKFRDLPVPRPENALFGVMFNARWHQFAFPAVVTNPSHWALSGTGLRSGDTLWMASGYEMDQLVDNGQTPKDVEVLTQSPSLSLQGAFGFSNMVVRQQGNAYIFSAGGIDFVHLLASDQDADPRAARIVANVLYRALGRSLPSNLVQFNPKTKPVPKWTPASAVNTVGGVAGWRAGPGDKVRPEQLGAPVAVAVMPDAVGGGWAVADALANAVKRVYPDGHVETVGRDWLNGPMGIAADAVGNIYVADSDNYCIRRIAPDGASSVFAGAEMQPGAADGPATQARFNQPAGMTLTPDGTALLVADVGNGVIRRISLLEPGNPVTTVQANAWLYRPSAVAAAADGTLYIVESGMARVVSLRDGTVSVVAGTTPGYQDGSPDSAQMLPYLGIAVLTDGSVVVADPGNYRLRRIFFGKDGKACDVTTFAGSGRYGAGDGNGREAEFVLPAGLALSPDGRTLYVADSGNGLVRAVTP